jgi:hypothetical protein
MSNRLPFIGNKHKICIICEGYEEYEYIKKLIELKVWNNQYEVTPINAKSNGTIMAYYQGIYQNGAYEIVFAFCDTDRAPYEQYKNITKKINDFHDKKNAAESVVIFGNPCTLQILILHWKDCILKSHNKHKNAPLIAQCTGVDGYKAKKEQRKKLLQKVNKDNYFLMKDRVANIDNRFDKIGSSNFIKLMRNLESENCGWISKLNAKLE